MEASYTATESEFNAKMQRIHELRIKFGLDALLLKRTSNFAWATCGASSYINRADSLGIAYLLITSGDKYVVTNNIESVRLMEEERLSAQGWKFQVVPWYQDEAGLMDLMKGMNVGSDAVHPNTVEISADLAFLRSQLSSEENERFRELGRLCAQGMWQAVNCVRPGMTEYELAGFLSQSVENMGVQAIVNLVATDERIFAYRHPLPTSKLLNRYAMLVLCGRKWGLICSLTRLIYFGPLPNDIRVKAEAIARIDAEMIAATRPNSTMGDVFRRAQTGYASAGFPEEWQRHHQGGSAGYAPREITATPSSTEPILVGQAYAWNPSISGVKSEDTILVGEHRNEILTEMADWPTINVQIGDRKIKRPAILEKII